MLISPSILSCDFLRLGDEIQAINGSKAGSIHIDVMDGHFVPNLSFGVPLVEAINKLASKPLDIHLMVENPELFIPMFVKYKPSFLSFHIEASIHPDRTLNLLKEHGIKAGLALNPHTPPSLIKYLNPDFILIMSVNPGFSGQKFIEKTLLKVKEIKDNHPEAMLQIDGGINQDNIKEIKKNNIDMVVVGHAIFKEKDIIRSINNFAEI